MLYYSEFLYLISERRNRILAIKINHIFKLINIKSSNYKVKAHQFSNASNKYLFLVMFVFFNLFYFNQYLEYSV